jgi:uncharacterized RDD family membrane protein YckC
MAEIQCRYCGTANDFEERRCVRCMRRLHLASPRPAPDNYPLAAATAPAFEAIPGRVSTPDAPGSAKPPDQRLSYQQPLFSGGPGAPKVVPIPTLAPRKGPGEAIGRIVAPRASGTRARRAAELQQPLEFPPAGGGAPIEVIDCDAPVALPTHRLMAAAVDMSIVLIALGVFGAILYFCGGDLTLTRQSAPVYLAVGFLTMTLYRLLWCLGNGDSPGMRFAGLRLVDFDGRAPSREQRLLRQLVTLLSTLSAGLGLVWALVDEESLTWHDHVSKTFPSPGA